MRISDWSSDVCSSDLEGLTPAQQLAAINERVAKLMGWQQDKWLDLIAELREAGIALIGADEVTPSEKRWLDAYFTAHLYPVLTPIAIDPAPPVPFIPNRGLCVVVERLRGHHRSPHTGRFPTRALDRKRGV